MIFLGLYLRFKCIADKCTHNCCTGWRVEVDKDTYKRFESLPDGIFKTYILDGIEKRDNKYHNKIKRNGECIFFLEDGLCAIQKKYGEDFVSFTCRKYPRRIYTYKDKEENRAFCTMSAACPVVASYLINENVRFYKKDSEGNNREIKKGDCEILDSFRLKSKDIEKKIDISDFKNTEKRIIIHLLQNFYIYRAYSEFYSACVLYLSDREKYHDEMISEIELIGLKTFEETCNLYKEILKVRHESELKSELLIDAITSYYREIAHKLPGVKQNKGD